MKKNYKTRLRDFIIANYPFYKAKTGKRILCFHDIQNQQAFEVRIKWLMLHFEIVSIEKLLQAKRNNLIAISFDDAYQSWTTNAAPILEKYKLPATFFVNSGLIGLTGKEMENYFSANCNRSPEGLTALSKKELLQLAKNPLFEIAGHTKDHFLFSESTDPKTLETQIFEDKINLESLCGRKLKYFAYPFGQIIHAPKKVQEVVKKSGYKNAFTIVPGFVAAEDHPFLIGRDSLELFQSDKVWDRWLHGAYDQLVHKKNKLYRALCISYR